jgi:YggT family protein
MSISTAGWLIATVNLVTRLVIIVLVIQAVLTYFLPPYNPVRQRLDRLVYPLLAPIRRVMPNTGPLDFSPLVLIIAVEILDWLLVRIITWIFLR